MTLRMTPRLAPLLALAVGLLAGCAKPGPFPSLAVRDSERMTGTIEAPVDLPPPPPPAVSTDLSELAARIRAANARFLAAADEARRVVGSAAGSAEGSEGWSRAQVAIANLESIRSDGMIALADIDRIHAATETGGGDARTSEAVRTEASALVAEQDRLITGLLAQLGS